MRDSCKQVSHVASRQAFLQGNKAGHAVARPFSAIQATLAMRPVKHSIQPAAFCSYVGFLHQPPRLQLRHSCSSEDVIAVRREWCEALSLQIRPWRALRAVSPSTQISKKCFFWRFGESKLSKRGLLAKNTRFHYLRSTQK